LVASFRPFNQYPQVVDIPHTAPLSTPQTVRHSTPEYYERNNHRDGVGTMMS
jgi:hypothetical protein